MAKLVAASFNCEWNPVFGRSKVISSTGCNKIIVQSMFRILWIQSWDSTYRFAGRQQFIRREQSFHAYAKNSHNAEFGRSLGRISASEKTNLQNMRKICDFFENAKSPHSAVENCSHMHRNRIRSHVFNVIEIHRRREKNLQKKGLTSEVTTFISLYLKKNL